MTKRKATVEEARKFIIEKLQSEYLVKRQLKEILKENFPFSWPTYCKEKKIKEELK